MKILEDTTNYAAWLDAEKRDRLRRMAKALQDNLMREDGIGPEMRVQAIARINRWLDEAGES